MKQFFLEIATVNVAVDPEQDGGLELAELIKHVGDAVAQGYRQGHVRDANGNYVGEWAVNP